MNIVVKWLSDSAKGKPDKGKVSICLAFLWECMQKFEKVLNSKENKAAVKQVVTSMYI